MHFPILEWGMESYRMDELSRCLVDRLDRRSLSLEPLDVACAAPVFKGLCEGEMPVFVKLALPQSAERYVSFLRSAGSDKLLPRVLCEPFPMGDRVVLCLEWKEAVRVNAEEMSEDQASSLLSGCVRLSGILQCAQDVADPPEEETTEFMRERLVRYCTRHPFVGRFLRELAELPDEVCMYGSRKLVTVHGDLQPKNYGFEGNDLAAVFDFDDVTRGLACEDLAYAFTERARRSTLSASSRHRLQGLFACVVRDSPWPIEEWRIAVNRSRLRIATRRLRKHPNSVLVALDICRRDRPLAKLLESIA